MTVTSSTSKSRYTGNGVTTAFTGSFRILDEDHVLVTLTDTDGVDAVKTITTDYTVSGVGGSSHTVTFLVAPPLNYTVTLSRNVPATQELDLVPNDDMPADELEKAFDKNVMLVQQIKEAIDRSVRFPISDSTSRTAELPGAADRAGKILAFDADGDVIVSTRSLDDIESGATDAAASASAAASSESAASASASSAASSAASAAASAATIPTTTGNGDTVPVVNSDGASWLYKTAAQLLTFLGISSASESASGIIEIATAAETTTGTDDTRAITPKKLTEFAPASAAVDTTNDKVLFIDATDGRVKQGSFPSTSLAKPQSATYVTNADLSTTIPVDDTVPQNTEGTEIVTVSITPSSASNKVRVRAYFYGQGNVSVVNMVGAIFRDSGASALTGGIGYARSTATNTAMGAYIEVVDSPATTSAVTYKLRVGPDAGTMRLNGGTGGRLFGGALTVGIFVEEVPV